MHETPDKASSELSTPSKNKNEWSWKRSHATLLDYRNLRQGDTARGKMLFMHTAELKFK